MRSPSHSDVILSYTHRSGGGGGMVFDPFRGGGRGGMGGGLGGGLGGHEPFGPFPSHGYVNSLSYGGL